MRTHSSYNRRYTIFVRILVGWKICDDRYQISLIGRMIFKFMIWSHGTLCIGPFFEMIKTIPPPVLTCIWAINAILTISNTIFTLILILFCPIQAFIKTVSNCNLLNQKLQVPLPFNWHRGSMCYYQDQGRIWAVT